MLIEFNNYNKSNFPGCKDFISFQARMRISDQSKSKNAPKLFGNVF